MTVRKNSPEARDIAYHFHSYTNAVTHAQVGPKIIESGDGIYVTDSEGNKYIEAMAGALVYSFGIFRTAFGRCGHQTDEGFALLSQFCASQPRAGD